MDATLLQRIARGLTALAALAVLVLPAVPAVKNMAVVVSSGSKLSDVPLADLVKMCKGATKSWPDGKNFTLVLKNPDAPEMHVALQKLFGVTGPELRAALAKLNEGRQVVRIVDSDDELLRQVEMTPGALGIVDVYSINNSVKVLRIDGKLPFDLGYAFRGN
ncbi:MAG TPA: hypothetical protein VMT51_00490 [Dongiaceae bacterium]|nr:hypothetical protein [Dongiaceae bacterium]